MAEKKISHATALLNLVKQLPGGELFHDPQGVGYLFAPVFIREHAGEPKIGHYGTFPLDSEACRNYLQRTYYNNEGKSITRTALQDAIGAMAGSASVGPCHKVYARIASFADRVVIDLGTEDHNVVIITRDGWDLVSCPTDVRFVRRSGSGMLSMPAPVRSRASLQKMIPCVLNIKDRNSILLLLAWWIVALRGKGPFLVLIIRGGAGSAKSNALLIIRDLVDPNSASKNHVPRTPDDLTIAVENCYVLSMDNVSHITEEIADAICVLATGGGLRKRKLFTDGDEKIFQKSAPVVLNGIPDVLARADLGSRSAVIELEPIPAEQRKTEAEIEALKSKVLPKLFGRLLDVISGVLQREHIRPPRLPRMADVAVTLTAAEQALGVPNGTFIDMLNQQNEAAADAVLESNEDLLQALMDPEITDSATLDWEGELKQLLLKMPGGDENRRPWTAKKLANALRRLNDVLPRAGLRVLAPKGQSKCGAGRDKRVWRIERVLAEAGTHGTRRSSSLLSRDGDGGGTQDARNERDVSHVSPPRQDLPF